MIDRKELAEIYPRLMFFALRLTKNRENAEDLAHAAVERALEYEDHFKDNSNLWGYVSKVLFNLFLTGKNRDKLRARHLDARAYYYPDRGGPNQRDTMLDLIDTFNKLRASDRDLIVMSIKGLEYKEMADKLGVPLGTVRSRLSRARDAMVVLS